MLNQTEKKKLADRVKFAIGKDNLTALSKIQAEMCEVLLTKRLEKLDFDIDKISDEELVGIYEMVTNELQPLDL